MCFEVRKTVQAAPAWPAKRKDLLTADAFDPSGTNPFENLASSSNPVHPRFFPSCC